MNNLNLPLLETTLGIKFRDLNLLEEALTHRSFLNEHADVTFDNERLEFLGDAVIDLIVGAYLFERFPEMQEGELSALRAAIVRTRGLADFACKLTIDQHLLLGIGEEDAGGRKRLPNLCAAFEAVVGAIYRDQGLNAVTSLLQQLVPPAIDHILAHQLHKDAKSEFQIWAQATFNVTPQYKTASSSGPDHAKTFIIDVYIGEELWGTGSGSSKRTAAQDAAKNALLKTEQL